MSLASLFAVPGFAKVELIGPLDPGVVSHAEQENACLTLPEVLAIAQKQGPEIRVAQANADAAGARIRQERGTSIPQVSAYARAAEGDIGLVDGRTNTQAGVIVSQRLLDFGQSAARRRALAAYGEAAMLETRKAVLDAQGDAGFAFLSILELEELLIAAGRREMRFQTLAEGLPRRLDAGLITIATASSIRAQIAASRAERVEREASLQAARVRFQSLVGEGTKPCPGKRIAGLALSSPISDEAEALAAVDDAPGVLAAEARIEAARADVDVARRIQRPEISVQAVAAYQYDTLLREWNPAQRVGLNVSIPLYGGGTFSGERDEANARLTGAQAEADQMRRDVAEELRASLRRADAFGDLADARAEEVNALSAEVEAARRQFDQGLRPYQDYQLTEASLASAEAEAIKAQYRALRERLTIAVLTQSLPIPDFEGKER